MLLNDWSGGLKTRIHPTLIQPTESQEYTNCDNEAGILRPITVGSPAPSVDTYTYIAPDGTRDSSNTLCYQAEVHDIIYNYELELTRLIPNGGGTTRIPAGIKAPTIAPLCTITLGPATAEGEEDPDYRLRGVYTYVYTYYSSVTLVESAPSPISKEVGHAGDVFFVDVPLTADTYVENKPWIDTYRVYRSGGDLTHYSLVAERPISATYAKDNNYDYDIAGEHKLDTFGYNVSPSGGKYLTKYNTMLVLAVGTKVYFSKPAHPEVWSRTDYIDIGEKITGLGAMQQGMLVFTKYSTYIVVGNDPMNVTVHLLSREQGCVNHFTIQYTNNSLVWLSQDGVCTSGGGDIKVITKGRLGVGTISGSYNAAVWKRAYYLATSSGTLILDFRYSNMCIRRSSVIGRLTLDREHYGLIQAGNFIEHAGTPKAVMSYKSPLFTEGRFSELKQFKDFYIAYKGDITLKVYLHTVRGYIEVLSKSLSSQHHQATTKSLGNLQGYGIHYTIEGTGEVYEIDFKAVGRENAK